MSDTPEFSIDRCILDLEDVESALRDHAEKHGRGEIARNLSAIATQIAVAKLAIRGLRVVHYPAV